jgi:hypothetical protein
VSDDNYRTVVNGDQINQSGPGPMIGKQQFTFTGAPSLDEDLRRLVEELVRARVIDQRGQVAEGADLPAEVARRQGRFRSLFTAVRHGTAAAVPAAAGSAVARLVLGAGEHVASS